MPNDMEYILSEDLYDMESKKQYFVRVMEEDCVTDAKDDWMRRQQQQDERLANDIEYILSEDWYVDTLRAEALPSS